MSEISTVSKTDTLRSLQSDLLDELCHRTPHLKHINEHGLIENELLVEVSMLSLKVLLIEKQLSELDSNA